MVVLTVLATGIPAPKPKEASATKVVDPLGIESLTAETEASEKVTAIESVAYISATIDPKLAEEAYKIADEQAAKVSLPVSGDSFAKLASVETVSSAKDKASSQKYVVQNGDTLWSIARSFGITTDSIKWSNGITDENFVKPGITLNIPSITGIIYTVKAGDSIQGIASRYKSSASMLIAQNDLYGEEIKAGMVLIIPDGVIEEVAPTPAPRTQVATRTTGYSTAPRYVSTSTGPNRFPWGWCTWYVASRRYVPWSGNAGAWYYNAQRYGRAVGRTPVPGAIYVSWESSVGHVGYVEAAYADGSYKISEMNARGFGVISSRVIRPGSVPLIGFIY